MTDALKRRLGALEKVSDAIGHPTTYLWCDTDLSPEQEAAFEAEHVAPVIASGGRVVIYSWTATGEAP